MEYTVNGVITLSPESKRRLSSKVDFISPLKMNVSLTSESDEKLSVLIKLEADSDTVAQELAQSELSRICNLLSFHNNIGIYKSGITGMSCTSISKGHANVSFNVKLGISTTIDVVLTLGNESLKKLVSNLEQNYSADFEEVIYVWREAMSRESSVERFFSLYRLMEYMFRYAKSIDDWIINKDPSVQLLPQSKYRDYTHTVYTYLRDNIHYKKEKKLFPIKEIQDNLPKFQTLVQQAIKWKYNIQ